MDCQERLPLQERQEVGALPATWTGVVRITAK
jgi:hypothetical protein